MPERPRLAWPTIRAFALELTAALGAATLGAWAWHPVITPLAFVVVATRQHALFILYHDAVHGLVAKPMRLNDLLVNAFAGVPMLLPVHVYRALHLTHHRTLGTEHDPERLLLYRGQDWQYQPLPMRALLRQLALDTLLVNQLKTVWAYVAEQRSGRLRLPPTRAWPELALLALLWGAAATALGLAAPELALRLAVLWLGPLLTLTQGIQKVRSFAEHAALDAPELSYSWAPGWFGRLVLWPYNIHYHREHHAHPGVPWYALPEAFPERDARPGGTLRTLLWNSRW